MRVYGFYYAAVVIVSTGVVCAFPPPNDDFANSTAISGSSVTVPGHNNDATIEPGEPVHQAFSTTYKSVWWTWTAPANAEYTFEADSLAFTPLIGIYTGNSLTNLTRASEIREHITHIEAQQNKKYHIVVASYNNSSGGITLKCYYDPLSADISKLQFTKKFYSLHASSSGDILYEPYKVIYYSSFRTNKYGVHFNTGGFNEQESHGVTLITSKGKVILSKAAPASLGMKFAVCHFDGSYVYIYDHDSSKLIAFKIKNNELQEQGSQVIDNFFDIHLAGSTVIAVYKGIDPPSLAQLQGLRAFNRTLKKQVREYLPVLGTFDYFSDKGVYRHVHRGEYAYQLSIHKKGKKAWTVNIPYKTKYLQHRTDDKGATLYWYYILNYPANTNEPLTLVSKKGTILHNQMILPNAGSVWSESNFKNDRFFVSPPAPGNTHTIYGYKLGKKIKELGPVSVDFYYSMWMFAKNLSVSLLNTMPPYVYGLQQYDTNLKKMLWHEAMADSVILYADAEVFLRSHEFISGGQTNLQVKIFGKKGVIAEHTIAR